MERRQPHLTETKTLQQPSRWVQMLLGEYSRFAYDEKDAPLNKGKWREIIFGNNDVTHPIDLEIGTGNGTHFAYRLEKFPERGLIGIEIKYKQLIQTIRAARRKNLVNGRVAHFHAFSINTLFAHQEVNNIYIHFPDPWPKKRHWKNRFVNPFVLQDLYEIQKPGGLIEFKTDSRDYFDWALEHIKNTPYEIKFLTYDLHSVEHKDENFVTQFENIFIKKNIPINMVHLLKK